MSVDTLVAVVTGVVTVFSALASAINHVVRTKQTAGESVAPALLGAGAAVNVGALNLDKALQLVKLLRDLKASSTATPQAPTSDTTH